MPRMAVTIKLPLENLTPMDQLSIPTPKGVRRLKKEIYMCARYVDSDAGGGNHGHLGMVMNAADYAAAAPGAAAWADPINPAPPAFAAGVAAYQMQNDLNNYELEKNDYTIAQSLEGKLQEMILKAVQRAYLNALADPVFGFAGVRVRDMLDHLQNNYGTITHDDLEANEEELKLEWDPSSATEIVFDNAHECQAFATAGGDQITDQKVMREVLKTFEKSGVLGDAVKDWRKKPAAAKTVANMRTHFLQANQRRLRVKTSATAGYGTANAATIQGTNDNNGMISMSPDDLQRLLAMYSANAATRVAAPAPPNPPPPAQHPQGGYYYCWTHGLSMNPNHTSATCNRQAPGHQATATLTNMMGGNNSIARRRGERAVYRRPQRPNNEA